MNLLKYNNKAVCLSTMCYSDLQLLLDRQQKKCEKLEQNCRDEETNHWQDISKLQEKNKVRLGCLFYKIRLLSTVCIY